MNEKQYLSEDQDNYFPVIESWDYHLDNIKEEINLNFDCNDFNLGY